jgi:hypothetical protein
VPQRTSGGQGQVITFFMTFFDTPLTTPSNGRFWVMTRVISGNNEVTKLPKMKIVMAPKGDLGI